MGSRLVGKVALITGGAGGIGSAVGRIFSHEGAKVALVDVDAEALEGAMKRAGGGSAADALAIAADITNQTEADRAVAEVLTQFGHLHVLVNNAAVREDFPLAEAPPDSWSRILQVNLLGVANCSKAALPALRRAGGASIVNVSSVYAVVGRAGMGQYDATKAAILALTRVLAVEEAPHGVRVNAVCPGSTITPFTIPRTAARGFTVEQLRTRGVTDTPIGRWAEPEEIAYPILWLASDEASFITGATLMVDGGLSIV